MTVSLRLMTANLLHGGADSRDFARVLDRVDPDVVATQELGPDCAEAIAARYPHHYLRPSVDKAGRGIGARFDAEFGDLRDPTRNGAWARLGIDGRVLRLASVHLLNPIEFPWWVSLPGRGDQLAAIFEWADASGEDDIVVVAGDMNASPRWPAYRRLAERWDDLVAAQAEKAGVEPARTWGWRPGWPRMLRIDHVFGAGVRATSAWVEPVRGSDHAAVVVDLETLE